MSSSGVSLSAFIKRANTAFALLLGGGIVTTFSTPNDATEHLIVFNGLLTVIALETGGALQLQFTQNSGAQVANVDAGGHAAGSFPLGLTSVVCDPNSTVTLMQTTPLNPGQANLAFVLAVL